MLTVEQADREAFSHYMTERARRAFAGIIDPYADLLLETLAAHRIAGEQAIVEWLRAEADDIAPPETEGSDPLWTAHAFVHVLATTIERGDVRALKGPQG